MIETVDIRNGYLRPVKLTDTAFLQHLFNDNKGDGRAWKCRRN